MSKFSPSAKPMARRAFLGMTGLTLLSAAPGCGWFGTRRQPRADLSQLMRSATQMALGVDRQAKLLFATGLRIEEHEQQLESVSAARAKSLGLMTLYQTVLAAFVEQHRLLDVEKKELMDQLGQIARRDYQDRLAIVSALQVEYATSGQTAHGTALQRAAKGSTEIERFGFLPKGYQLAEKAVDPTAEMRRTRFARFYNG